MITTAKTLVDALRRKKILTMKEICEITQRSPMTVWRTLKPIGYYTSFNHNGSYYTLAETARFDSDGLWFYRDVGFSESGTLNRTLVALVDKSKTGMTPNELSTILQVRVQNQLYHLFAMNQVARAQSGRAHLYLSREEDVRRAQLRGRESTEHQAPPSESGGGPPSETETIAILAELARTPSSSARRIATVLQARGLEITRSKVLAVIDKYDLRKKRASRRSKR